MKIDISEIRQRLSNNTAIDAKEIQALCDEVESQDKAIEALINNIKYLSDRLLKDFN